LIRLVTISACDRRTDGETDGIAMAREIGISYVSCSALLRYGYFTFYICT